MRIFPIRQICVACSFSEVSSKTLRLTCRYRRRIICAILVPAAILMAIAVVRGSNCRLFRTKSFFRIRAVHRKRIVRLMVGSI